MWRDAAWVLDMLNACRRVTEYARGLTEEGFLASPRDQDAILRQLTVAGEAAKLISGASCAISVHPGRCFQLFELCLPGESANSDATSL